MDGWMYVLCSRTLGIRCSCGFCLKDTSLKGTEKSKENIRRIQQMTHSWGWQGQLRYQLSQDTLTLFWEKVGAEGERDCGKAAGRGQTQSSSYPVTLASDLGCQV